MRAGRCELCPSGSIPNPSSPVVHPRKGPNRKKSALWQISCPTSRIALFSRPKSLKNAKLGRVSLFLSPVEWEEAGSIWRKSSW